jgi:hypothetical protein
MVHWCWHENPYGATVGIYVELYVAESYRQGSTSTTLAKKAT